MLFSSTVFLYFFFPVVLIFNCIIFRKNRLLQNIFLLFASLIFYGWGEPFFVLIMISSITVNWLLSILLINCQNNYKICRTILITDIVLNIGLLFVFKYLSFTIETIDKLFGFRIPIPNIVLPIGISFFTFQAMSYVIDVYRKKGKAQSNILNVGLYIAFFPQLIAGPIVRYETVYEQILNRKEGLDDLFSGFSRFVVGLSKKVLLANSFAIIADQSFGAISNGERISVLFGWLGAIAYTLQIFYDFSGYSDMAIGLGRIFGFTFLENFNYPYVSKTITEFWRRWHISLGTWFRDYLYIPLGGNRCSKKRNIFNIFLVWLLTGIWHGANFTFILWGLMYFLLLIVEKFTDIDRINGTIANIFKRSYTIIFIIIGWVIFRSDSVFHAYLYIKSMLGLNNNEFVDSQFYGWFIQNIILLFIGVVFSTPLFKNYNEKNQNNNIYEIAKMIILSMLLLLSVASLVSNSYNPFIYFNF